MFRIFEWLYIPTTSKGFDESEKIICWYIIFVEGCVYYQWGMKIYEFAYGTSVCVGGGVLLPVGINFIISLNIFLVAFSSVAIYQNCLPTHSHWINRFDFTFSFQNNYIQKNLFECIFYIWKSCLWEMNLRYLIT